MVHCRVHKAQSNAVQPKATICHHHCEPGFACMHVLVCSPQAPIQRIADKIAGYFVPAIIILAFITFSCWLIAIEVNLHVHVSLHD